MIPEWTRATKTLALDNCPELEKHKGQTLNGTKTQLATVSNLFSFKTFCHKGYTATVVTNHWFPSPLFFLSKGTHVIGTIGASNNDIGVVGVAPDANIKVIRVFDNDGVFASDLVEATQQCASTGAKIISMSLGGAVFSLSESDAMERLHAQGILSIAAAGNDGGQSFLYPAVSSWMTRLQCVGCFSLQ